MKTRIEKLTEAFNNDMMDLTLRLSNNTLESEIFAIRAKALAEEFQENLKEHKEKQLESYSHLETSLSSAVYKLNDALKHLSDCNVEDEHISKEDTQDVYSMKDKIESLKAELEELEECFYLKSMGE